MEVLGFGWEWQKTVRLNAAKLANFPIRESDTPTVARNHKISKNHIHHVMQILSDGGGFIPLGGNPVPFFQRIRYTIFP